MKKSNFHSYITSLLLLLFLSSANADRKNDIETIFNWAEQNYSIIFSPAGTKTQLIPNFNGASWHYRHYTGTNLFMGINSEDKVFIYDPEDNDLTYIDSISAVLTMINNSQGSVDPNNCATIPLVTKGLKMTQKITIGNFPSSETKTEYIEVSTTHSKRIETEVDKSGKIDKNVIEENFIIADNYMAISGNTITTFNNGVAGSASIVTNTPSVRKAINHVCMGQSWRDNYIMKASIKGVEILALPIILASTVEAIHEPITTTAGTFDTVRLRHSGVGLGSYSWISTKYGVKVRGGHYKTSGEFVGEEELVFIE